MTERYELIDKFKIVDAFEPDKVLLIALNKDDAKKFCDMLNRANELEKEVRSLKEERRILKVKLSKADVWKEKCQESLATRVVETEKFDSKSPRKKPTYKDKTCIDCGTVFTPRSGSSKRCESCQAAENAKRTFNLRGYKKQPTLKVEMRGNSFYSDSPGVVRVPTVDEVIRMPPGPERLKWESRWSEAERQYAQREKNRIEMDKMRAIRNKGFTLDDPIMGVNAPTIGYKK